jgi:hypothetical protein
MKALAAILRDRKRSQRGSVLSGVLIMVAFLAIISGALMTELSTNLLLSRALVNRVGNEATVNSALELTLDRLQNAPLINGCPSLSPVNLNGRTAALSYISCALVVDSASTQFQQIADSAPYNVDGTHAVLPAQGRNDYVVGDAAGNVFVFRFDVMTQRWNLALGGSVSGPALEMPDASNSPHGVIDLVPISSPDPGATPDCGPANFCVASIKDGGGSNPSLQCFMAASAKVKARPAAGIRNSDLTYFGDGNGELFAYDADDGQCARQDSATTPGARPVVAGPIVFSGPTGTDELYLLVSNGTSSQLVHYTYQPGGVQASGLVLVSSLALPGGGAVGMALEPGTLPSRLAITFSGGQVALAQIQAGFGVSLLTSRSVPTRIAGAPYWCQCPGGDLIGVGGRTGGLYLFDTSLNPSATYPSGGAAISTTPAADSGGDWFFGSSDGKLYEVQRHTGSTTMVLGATFGPAGASIGSSPIVGTCRTSWICVYTGSTDSHAYVVPLDARNAVITACISTSPPACSGTNPRLWATVEVGSASSPNTVHVGGWSYYSP